MFLSEDISTQVGTFALLPQVVQAVSVPVIAAGGIADARGVRAAMDLGAAGVQVGTAYLLCHEANTSAVHRAALKSDAARITALTNIFSGRPARAIVNRLVKELGPISAHTPGFPLAMAASAPLRARAESMGSGDFLVGPAEFTQSLRQTQNSAGLNRIVNDGCQFSIGIENRR